MKFVILAARATPGKWTSATKRFPAGRRPEICAGVPIRAKLIVFFSFSGVAKNFVSLIDFLKFFLGLLLVFGDVGMMLASQLPKSFFNVGVIRGARDTENIVIIFILHGHSWCFALQCQCSGN